MKVGVFQHELAKKGQNIYKFSNCYLFILQEKYRTAGKQHWPQAVENGEPMAGFSINSAIWETIPIEDLLIFEVSESRFYKLVDREKVRKLKGRNRRNGVLLYVLPLSSYSSVQIEDIENIINSPVPYSRTDLTMRQSKLEVSV